jgi:hypothetical protein
MFPEMKEWRKDNYFSWFKKNTYYLNNPPCREKSVNKNTYDLDYSDVSENQKKEIIKILISPKSHEAT